MRFSYVMYDEKAKTAQESLKKMFEDVEKFVNENISDGRAKALVMTKLEEAYMWIGKAIRDDQLARGNIELQEERSNS